ncbi:MAG TPA: cytochrome b N-terminal domain-containing protein [Terriglobales bacterium]|nr:cytochrome b N-terminal domain-containing protein [Terriglobales bacterium]
MGNQPPAPRPHRLRDWLDQRTGLRRLLHESLDEPVPGGARWAYVFGSGLLLIFISQIVTGLCLALYYVPSAESAHVSVAYITKQVAAGAFLRSLHSYGASAMIVVLALHFLQTFLYGSYKGRRELLWISGATTALLVLGMGFTGYLLPWDQKAYFATAVGTNVIGEVPWIGAWLTRLLRGGDTLGTLTLSRFYVAHVFLIPGAMFLLIGIHVALFRKAGPAGPMQEDPLEPKLPRESFYPRQVLMDMGFAFLLIAALGVLAYFHPVALGPVANPAEAHFLPRPEWYYLPLFEWLKFWEGPSAALAIVGAPGLLALLFFLLPFLDRGLERRPWRRPLPLLGVSIVLAGVLFLGGKSRWDDAHDPTVAAQLALQAARERAYNAAPFHPYSESPGSAASPVLAPAPPGPLDPRVAQGRGLFDANGCTACHGELGMGTANAPSLVAITKKFSPAQITALLHNPNAAMRAGGMPAFQLSGNDMDALISYLGVLGTTAASVTATFNAPPQVAAAVAEVNPSAAAPAAAAAPGPSAAELALGHQMFQTHACFACHGQQGLGTVRAPALAPLVQPLSDAAVTVLLLNPNAKMRAGGMPALQASPEQVSALVGFLRTLSPPPSAAVATSPAPSTPAAPAAPTPTAPTPPAPSISAGPTPPPAPAAPALSPRLAAGHDVFLANGCAACHGPTGAGTPFAPSLLAVGRQFTPSQLGNLIRHPTKKMRDGGMPTISVSDTQLQNLVAFVSNLGPAAAARPAPAPGRAAAPSGARPTAPAPPPPPRVLTVAALRGQKLFERLTCETCHGTDGLRGTIAAPGLAGTASLLPASTLENLLRHHSTQMQRGGMPLTNLNPRDMRDIIAFIRSLPSNPVH